MIFDMIAMKLSGRDMGECGSIIEVTKWGFVHDLPQTLNQLIKQDQEKIIFLETIDLRLLPTSTRLLSSILARIDACVADKGLRSIGLLERRYDALMELQRLQCDVVIGLEGNLDERKGFLDPDTYAMEVMRAARATVGITKRFHETLAALGKDHFVVNSLFLIGIILSKQDTLPPSLKLFNSPHMLIVVERSDL